MYADTDFIRTLIKYRDSQHKTKPKSFTTVDLSKNISQGHLLAEDQIKMTSSPGLTKDKNDFYF